MFIPLPVLITVAFALVLLILWLLRRRAGPDRLMGVQPPRSGPAAASAIVGAHKGEAAAVPLSPEVEARVRALLAANRKIEAIKVAREATGLGLKAAKDLVEAFR